MKKQEADYAWRMMEINSELKNIEMSLKIISYKKYLEEKYKQVDILWEYHKTGIPYNSIQFVGPNYNVICDI